MGTEERLRAALPWLASLPIFAFAAVAFYHAGGSYLLPDEAQQFWRADAPTLGEAYRNAFTQSHPPLYVVLLHLATRISTAQIFLRGLSIAAGAGAAWLLFGWLRRAADERVALAGVALFASSPALLIAAQLRQYGLLLLLVCGALYCMERLLAERSAAWTVAYSFCVYGILLTFYGGAWVVLALGLYLPWRLWREHSPRPVVLTWAGFQIVGVGVGAWLAIVHVDRLRGAIEWAASGFLLGSYRPPDMSRVEFAWQSTSKLFQSFAHGLPLREHPLFGSVLLLFFLVGLAWIAARPGWRRGYPMLLVLPIALACMGGSEGWLPFGGTRHVSYLLPFVTAGAAAAVVALLPRLRWLLLAMLVIVPLRLGHAVPPPGPGRLALADVRRTIGHIETEIPKGSTIFADRQAFYLLRYYMAAGQKVRATTLEDALVNDMAGYRFVSPRGTQAWRFKRSTLHPIVALLARGQGLRRGAPVWVVSHNGPKARLKLALPAGSLHARIGSFEVIRMPLMLEPAEQL